MLYGRRDPGSGTVTGTYSYDVFGTVRAQTGGGANQWQFTGEQRDADSALYFLRERYYDPATGRFLGKDPLNIGNRYSYVSNNPANFTDPYGLLDLTPSFLDDAVDTAKEVYTDLISPAAAIGDIVGQFSTSIPVASTALGLAAAVTATIDIWTSCLLLEEKIGLTGLNAVNVAIDVATVTNPVLLSNAAWLAGSVAVEAAIYGFTTHVITDKCGDIHVVYARAAVPEIGSPSMGSSSKE